MKDSKDYCASCDAPIWYDYLTWVHYHNDLAYCIATVATPRENN